MAKKCIVTTTYIQENKHLQVLDNSVYSIKKAYNDTADIIILDDHSPIQGWHHLFDGRAKVIPTKYECSAEMSPYDFILNNELEYEQYLTAHDGMIHQSVVDIGSDDIKFIYHSNNHFNWPGWHVSDIFEMKENLPDSNFKRNFDALYHDKANWFVCYGISCAFTKPFLQKLEEQTGVCSLTKHVINKKHRMALESIFGMACFYVKPSLLENPSIDGLLEDFYKLRNKQDKHIIKYSFDRKTKND